jgi:hypothetical protein
MRMRVCYLDWHEAGLYCYLLIHIKNLLPLLLLFYSHLWHIYWTFIVIKIFQLIYTNFYIGYLLNMNQHHGASTKYNRFIFRFSEVTN